MMRRASILTLIATGLVLWLAVAALHDLAAAVLGPVASHITWLFP